VVGGGDSALEEGLFLTRYATKVTIVHRRDQLRAQPFLQKQAFAHPKIEFIWNTVVTEILGDEAVKGVRLRNVKTGEEREMPIDGVFIFIGHVPNTDLFKGQLELDERGYIKVQGWVKTSVPGVFAARWPIPAIVRSSPRRGWARLRPLKPAISWRNRLKRKPLPAP